MRFPLRSIAVLAAVVLAGCKSRPEARYVARTADTGVIAMPADTPENRQRAFALMQSHFPEGYEVVAEGEEAVLAPLPPPPATFDDPMWAHRRMMHDPVAAAAWTDPGFQRSVEDLPGTPQAMKGYARPPAPTVGIRVGDPPPPRPTGVLRSEWRITYRRKGAASETPGSTESLFPAESERSEPRP